MRWLGWAAVLLFSATAIAQQIPAGTVIPVMLNTSLNASKDGAGKNIEGKVMQDVLTPLGFTISKGSKVTGQIVSAGKSGGSDSTLVLKFDSIQDHGRTVPLTAAVLAVASMQSVAQAQAPINSNPDMLSASSWTNAPDWWRRRQPFPAKSWYSRRTHRNLGRRQLRNHQTHAQCRRRMPRRPRLRSPTGRLDLLQFGLRNVRFG